MVKTQQWLLNAHPSGLPTYSGSNPTFKKTETELPSLKADQILVKVKYFSNDPAQRGWIDRYEDESRLYVPAVHIGDVMRSSAIAEVVESQSEKFKKGDLVSGVVSWTEHAVLDANAVRLCSPLPGNAPVTHYLGAFGLTGLTAYIGLLGVAEATKDDIVIVSGAAGATGSMVVQIAKRVVGCKKVIGIAGGQEKCDWVKKLGADECIDYKAGDFEQQLIKATSEYANVYFDNVGGQIMDFVLTRMARNGRVAACGSISQYNSTEGDGSDRLKNWFQVISMRLRIQGFIVLDHPEKMQEALKVLPKALEEGKLDITEGEHVVEAKFDDVPATWLKLFEGGNTGKLITKLI
ncbi:hypothetical protein KVR01_006207 [Diaporthe batatas]|uniref:uncharacterized protein n=1 Tax=Diaporthe batatas TaxID=748121 RepID=UPI001D04048C|nr:uncharacterized protein KVR01_006207 [Diaporthe batatas]KAG8164289.1 hypothetical protein KVR01_006207 [Diaporthe batatas]